MHKSLFQRNRKRNKKFKLKKHGYLIHTWLEKGLTGTDVVDWANCYICMFTWNYTYQALSWWKGRFLVKLGKERDN